MPVSMSEWITISLIWIFVTYLVLEHLPDGKVQNVLAIGNFFAFMARVFVLYDHKAEWDSLSRYAFVIAVVSAIITWFCIQIRKPSRIPITARMRRERDERKL